MRMANGILQTWVCEQGICLFLQGGPFNMLHQVFAMHMLIVLILWPHLQALPQMEGNIYVSLKDQFGF